MALNLSRDRDAWPAIRGFVAQTDLTIKRWLALADGELLELECGEDIDQIASGFLTGQELRIVEQVKQRESAVTLRSPEVVEAIANFVEHRELNPSTRILFRFTTSAQRGRERPPVVDDLGPGIDLWEAIRSGQLDQDRQYSVLQAIQRLLGLVPQPANLGAATWGRFVTLLDQPGVEHIQALIRDFEFATKEPLGSDLSEELLNLLVLKGHAPNKSAAQHCYDRLFVHVMKLLTQKGAKRLGRGDIESVLAAKLSQANADMLRHIMTAISVVEGRVTNLESRASQQETSIGLLDKAVQQLSSQPLQNTNIASAAVTISSGATVNISSAAVAVSRDTLAEIVRHALAQAQVSAPATTLSPSTSDGDLIARDGARMYEQLADYLDQWEFPKAYTCADGLETWLRAHESQLAREFMAKAYVLLADTHLVRAKEHKNETGSFDGSVVAAYLQKAHDATPYGK